MNGGRRVHLAEDWLEAARRNFVVAALVLAAVVTPAAPAMAHPALVASTPAAGYSVASAPASLSLQFNEPVIPERGSVNIFGGSTSTRLLPRRDGDGSMIRASLPALQPGVFRVTYRVIGRDGDLIPGEFTFGVAPPSKVPAVAAGMPASTAMPALVGARAQPSAPTGLGPSWFAVLLRTLLYLGVSLALGGLVMAKVARSALAGAAIDLPAPYVAIGLGIAGVGAAGLTAWSVVRSGGQFVTAAPVALPAFEAGGLLGACVLRRWAPAAWFGLLLVVALEGLRGHARAAAGAAGVSLTAVHLAAAAIWVGGLVHVLRLRYALRGRVLARQLVLRSYIRLATCALVVLVVTGFVTAVLLLSRPASGLLTAPYGRVLLLKLAVVLLAAGAAVVTHRRVSAVSEAPGGRVPPSGRVEVAALVVVLAVAAALVSAEPPPRAFAPAPALPPALQGPVLQTAALVGYVTVTAAAAADRLVLRMRTPEDGRTPRLRLTARLLRSGQPPQSLTLAACGRGCWSAVVQWAAGPNTVTLDAGASGWPGGRTSLTVPWPPRPAAQVVPRIRRVMMAESFKMTETVTSGFRPPPARQFRLQGRDWVSRQSWSRGGWADVVAVPGEVRTVRWLLPALDYFYQWRYDASYRLLQEDVVSPGHVIHRTFVYPQARRRRGLSPEGPSHSSNRLPKESK